MIEDTDPNQRDSSGGPAKMSLRDYYLVELNRNPEVPLFRIVVTAVKEMVRDGLMTPGVRMPSVRAVSQRLSVSVTTIVRAYRVMCEEGVIESRPRSGYYVRPAPDERMVLPPTCPVHDYVDTARAETTKYPGWLLRAREARSVNLENPLVLAGIGGKGGVRRAGFRGLPEQERFDVSGGATVRNLVADMLSACGLRGEGEHVVCTSGLRESLMLALGSVAQRGDAVAIEAPTEPAFMAVAKQLGLSVYEVPSCPRAGLDLDCLDRLMQQVEIRGVIVMGEVNFITGSTLSPSGARVLQEMASKNGAYVLNVHVHLGLWRADRPSWLSDTPEHWIDIGVIGDAEASIGGAELGWMSMPDRGVRDAIVRLKAALFGVTSWRNQCQVARSLDTPGAMRTRARIMQEARLFAECIRSAVLEHWPAGVRIQVVANSANLWLEIPSQLCCARSLALHGCDQAGGGVFVPGDVFSCSGMYGRYVHLSPGVHEMTVCENLVREAAALFDKVGRGGDAVGIAM